MRASGGQARGGLTEMGTEFAKASADIQVQVLIVDGGGAGLIDSILLAQLGIETLLVSTLPSTAILPEPRVLNRRAMEILGDVGVADRIYAESTPAEHMATSRS
jgi:2,4-dichlorophenol 6-monooxygenase